MREYTGFLNGWLCKVSDDPMHDSPNLVRSWCPTETLESDARAMGIEEGWTMHGHYSSGYSIQKPDGYYFRSYGYEIAKFQLPLRGKTEFFKTEIIPVSRPKGIRKTTKMRWHLGRWEKYSVTKGWVAA